MLAIIMTLLSTGAPQVVPEGIHSRAVGPATMCDITAGSAAEFRRKVDADVVAGKLVKRDAGPRFDYIVTPDGQWPIHQWAFAKPTEPAYPMATCRDVFQDKTGSIFQSRKMRCDASRAACDAAFLEFADLDKRAADELRGK